MSTVTNKSKTLRPSFMPQKSGNLQKKKIKFKAGK